MGTVEDIRQVIQDFLAPELRAITARLDAMDQKFEALRTEMNLRFEAQGARLDATLAKQDTRLAVIDGKIQQVIDGLDVNRRLQKLEERQAQPAA